MHVQLDTCASASTAVNTRWCGTAWNFLHTASRDSWCHLLQCRRVRRRLKTGVPKLGFFPYSRKSIGSCIQQTCRFRWSLNCPASRCVVNSSLARESWRRSSGSFPTTVKVGFVSTSCPSWSRCLHALGESTLKRCLKKKKVDPQCFFRKAHQAWLLI